MQGVLIEAPLVLGILLQQTAHVLHLLVGGGELEGTGMAR